MQQPPDFLYVFSTLADVAILSALLIGIRLAVQRDTPTQMKTWYALVLVFLIWFGVAITLSLKGFFTPSSALSPAVPLAILVPVISGLWFSFRSQAMTRLIEATPLSWLIGIQFYRVIGGIFLLLLALGGLPQEFAVPAGFGDVAVGLLALPVAWATRSGSRLAMVAARVWNYLGILDLVIAVGTGFLTSPGQFQILAIDHPNVLITKYPLVMIPVYFVPLSLILHGLALWKLNRMERGLNKAIVT